MYTCIDRADRYAEDYRPFIQSLCLTKCVCMNLYYTTVLYLQIILNKHFFELFSEERAVLPNVVQLQSSKFMKELQFKHKLISSTSN